MWKKDHSQKLSTYNAVLHLTVTIRGHIFIMYNSMFWELLRHNDFTTFLVMRYTHKKRSNKHLTLKLTNCHQKEGWLWCLTPLSTIFPLEQHFWFPVHCQSAEHSSIQPPPVWLVTGGHTPLLSAVLPIYS
jgi:hypothetical protein